MTTISLLDRAIAVCNRLDVVSEQIATICEDARKPGLEVSIDLDRLNAVGNLSESLAEALNAALHEDYRTFASLFTGDINDILDEEFALFAGGKELVLKHGAVSNIEERVQAVAEELDAIARETEAMSQDSDEVLSSQYDELTTLCIGNLANELSEVAYALLSGDIRAFRSAYDGFADIHQQELEIIEANPDVCK